MIEARALGGSTADRSQLGQGALFDLSARAKLRVTGADRLRYLNGQISNDLRKATEARTIYACVLSAKGRINADAFISSDGESFLIDSEPKLREPLAARLDRYIIADDVQVEDVTDVFALFHVIGPEGAALSAMGKLKEANRFGSPGTDLWVEESAREAAWQELRAALSVCDEEAAEMLRIEQGIPRWSRELTDEIIPTEANLEARAIDYEKGCYIGQEVISRIKMSGQTNKRLAGFVVEDEGSLAVGMRLRTLDDGKDVGWITSCALSVRLGRQIALGFLKRGFQEPGLQLVACIAESATSDVTVRVTALPFT